MTDVTLRMLAIIGVLPFSTVVMAQDAGSTVHVTTQGFCITKTGPKCEEVALPGSSIEIERLPRLADGTRVIYFYSDQNLKSKPIFFHVLEAEDMDEDVEYVASKAIEAQVAALPAMVKDIGHKLGKGGFLRVTAFREGDSNGKPVRVFSFIPVKGPGVFSGQVVDINGAVPVSQRVSFTVTREAPLDTSKPIKRDGKAEEDG